MTTTLPEHVFEASGSPPGEEPELGLEATGIDVGEYRDGPGLELPCLILPPGPMVDVGEMAPQGGLPMTMTGSDRDLDRRLENGDGTIELAPVGEDQGLAVEGGHQEHLVVAGETGRFLGVLEGLCRIGGDGGQDVAHPGQFTWSSPTLGGVPCPGRQFDGLFVPPGAHGEQRPI